METYYTVERNVQMLIYLMKKHGVSKVVVSPGTTNVCFVASIQQDPFFKIYSSVDERSAAYLACGMAAESGEAVALSCTGATASRNYLSGLTEAFYRKLPIMAITSTQHLGRIGQNMPQVIDRTVQLNDVCVLSVQIPMINNEEDEWSCGIKLNKALIALKYHGGGPVHINLATNYSKDFTVKELPATPIIYKFEYFDKFPPLETRRLAIYVGAHKKWSEQLKKAVEKFCEIYNAVVLCDHTSNYNGKYRIFSSIVCGQTNYISTLQSVEIMIHIGDVSGAEMPMEAEQVWRVNPDGEIRDTFRKLRYVYELDELEFFTRYTENIKSYVPNTEYYKNWCNENDRLKGKIPELPFSNVWIAQNTVNKLPEYSILHLGILNSLRSWNFFDKSDTILSYSNTGGFGIDGNISSLVGASLVHPQQLFFGVVGDLAFFYDMNVIGNRHIGRNLRLMIINNGRGTEFRNYNHFVARFGDDADSFMAAAGHYGNKSLELVKQYAKSLGYEYLSATNKDEYLLNIERFTLSTLTDSPMIFEVFTNSDDESDAIKIMHNLEISVMGTAKKMVKEVLGEKGVQSLKKIIKR